MADPLINTSALTQGVVKQILPSITDSLSPLIFIFKAVGIALLIYILFLILKALFSWRSAHRLKKIVKNLEKINDKLDIIISKNISKNKKDLEDELEKPEKSKKTELKKDEKEIKRETKEKRTKKK